MRFRTAWQSAKPEGICKMELRSQKVRKLAPEMDPLRMGMGWKAEELSKPQIIVESTYGNSHPGSAHLNIFVEEAVKGVDENGGKAARCAMECHRDMMESIIPLPTEMRSQI